jgi:ribonucleoside-triphosphate reductase
MDDAVHPNQFQGVSKVTTLNSNNTQSASIDLAPTFTHIRKRSGEVVDSSKIYHAILKAGKATGELDEQASQRLTLRVLGLTQALLEANTCPDVEKIQDVVEEVLLTSPFKQTAKAYILYRDQHNRLRDMIKAADIDLVDEYLQKTDWQVKENANMGYSLQGLNNHISSKVSKKYWLNKLYPKQICDAHNEGDLHIHDLGLLAVYCVGWDLQDLLLNGFKGAPGKAESKPAKHFRAALGQMVNFFYTLQGEAAGAQAFANVDTLLAPFIRMDNLPYKEVKQAIQEFVFNLNVATRVGFQTPFTNITLDLQPPKHMASQPAIVGGQPIPQTYGDFQHEMTIFNKAFLEVMGEGDAKGRVFTFPIPTYNIDKAFNWEADELDPLWSATAKYGIPYFANFVNSDMSPDDARSMCCRLRLDVTELRKRGGGLFGANPLTGSIGVVTINMPRIGYHAKDEVDFIQKLDSLMEIAKNSLEIKRKTLEQLTGKDLYPYTSYYLRAIKQRFDRYWENHFSTIGLVGLNEACQCLYGCDLGTEEGAAFGLRVLAHMRHRLEKYQQQTGHQYNLEATPAEGTSYRLAKMDQEKCPGMVYANGEYTKDGVAPFYSNSSQLPVQYTDDPFEVLDKQDDMQCQYTGGTVIHFFLGESVADPKAVRSFVKMVCENYHLPYFTLSPTFSICPEHGYVRGEHHTCPHCGKESEVYSRVVGYLRPVKQWNDGKSAEFAVRKTFQLAEK